MQDVIVIGGGYAGMAATLQLVRARRSVMVIDAGKGIEARVDGIAYDLGGPYLPE